MTADRGGVVARWAEGAAMVVLFSIVDRENHATRDRCEHEMSELLVVLELRRRRADLLADAERLKLRQRLEGALDGRIQAARRASRRDRVAA